MSKTFMRLADASALPDNGMQKICISGIEPIALYHVDGRFYATQDTCTHALASLTEGWLEGHEVSCPVHAAGFDIRDGEPQCFPATEPLRIFTTVVEDGVVCADLSTALKT
ncbi:MAG: non-heme iron oxygenase ferredoxin subunit [Pseudomonadota bacterium]